MKPYIATWRVYPEDPRAGYFTVRVFGTLREMRVHGYAHREGSNRSAYGMCNGWTKERFDHGRRIVLRERGEILLGRRHLRTGIIAHESLHAALRWAEWKRLSLALTDGTDASPDEERVCRCLGAIVRQVVDGCYRFHLLP